jgi:RecJ-like exonuclease
MKIIQHRNNGIYISKKKGKKVIKYVNCPSCGGTGANHYADNNPCQICGGDGSIPKSNEVFFKPKKYKHSEEYLNRKAKQILKKFPNLRGSHLEPKKDKKIENTKPLIYSTPKKDRKIRKCTCKYDRQGNLFGICLRCAEMQLDASNKGKLFVYKKMAHAMIKISKFIELDV